MFYHTLFYLLLIGSFFCMYKMALTDLQRRIIPDVYLFPFLFAGLIITHFFTWPISITDSIIGGTFGYFLGIIIGFIFENVKKDLKYPAIGLGDIKLLGAGGIWLGTLGLGITLLLSCIFSYIWSLLHKQKYIPFAPFFLISGFLSFIILLFLL